MITCRHRSLESFPLDRPPKVSTIKCLTVTSGTAGATGTGDASRLVGPLSLMSVELLLLLLASWFADVFFAFKMFGFGLSSTFDFFVTLSCVPCDCDTYPPCTIKTRSYVEFHYGMEGFEDESLWDEELKWRNKKRKIMWLASPIPLDHATCVRRGVKMIWGAP